MKTTICNIALAFATIATFAAFAADDGDKTADAKDKAAVNAKAAVEAKAADDDNAADDAKAADDEKTADDEKEGAKADAGSDAGFSRYQSIIDRQPFGPPPPGFDPSLPAGQQTANGDASNGGMTEAELSAEEQKMMSSVRVSVLNVTPSGAVMVGFTDSTTQPPVNYYLKVGETSTDAAKWQVKEADPSEGKVSLSKDGIDITLNVGGETKKGAPAGGKPSPSVPAMAGVRPGGPSSIRRPNMMPGAADGVGDAQSSGGALARLHERRMQRQAAEAAQRQAAENARAEREAKLERERAEREAKLEQERAEREAKMEADREQQRAALLQIQEELRRQREARNKEANGNNEPEQPQG